MSQLSVLLVAIACFGLTYGYSSLRRQIPNGYRVRHPCGRGIWEAVGHAQPQYNPTKNAFGLDVRKVLADRRLDWSQLCHLDSDGDGLTNGEELGDPGCKWKVEDGIRNLGEVRGHPGMCEPERSKCTSGSTFAECPNRHAGGGAGGSPPKTVPPDANEHPQTHLTKGTGPFGSRPRPTFGGTDGFGGGGQVSSGRRRGGGFGAPPAGGGFGRAGSATSLFDTPTSGFGGTSSAFGGTSSGVGGRPSGFGAPSAPVPGFDAFGGRSTGSAPSGFGSAPPRSHATPTEFGGPSGFSGGPSGFSGAPSAFGGSSTGMSGVAPGFRGAPTGFGGAASGFPGSPSGFGSDTVPRSRGASSPGSSTGFPGGAARFPGAAPGHFGSIYGPSSDMYPVPFGSDFGGSSSSSAGGHGFRPGTSGSVGPGMGSSAGSGGTDFSSGGSSFGDPFPFSSDGSVAPRGAMSFSPGSRIPDYMREGPAAAHSGASSSGLSADTIRSSVRARIDRERGHFGTGSGSFGTHTFGSAPSTSGSGFPSFDTSGMSSGSTGFGGRAPMYPHHMSAPRAPFSFFR